MTAYVVASYCITNPGAYAAYVPAVIATFAAYGCEPIVADYASQVIEGDPADVTVVLKFPSREAAMAWYNSREYEAIRHLRTDNSEGTVVLVDQWTPPA